MGYFILFLCVTFCIGALIYCCCSGQQEIIVDEDGVCILYTDRDGVVKRQDAEGAAKMPQMQCEPKQ